MFTFADEYDMPQLRDDVMTVAIELDCAWRVKADPHRIGLINIPRMCDMLPANSTLYKYIAKSYALWGNFAGEDKARFPQPFLLDILRNCTPLCRKDKSELKEELRNPCCFHEHVGEPAAEQCRQRQLQDGPFYNSFLGACMQSVYEYDKVCAAQAPEKEVKLEESMAC